MFKRKISMAVLAMLIFLCSCGKEDINVELDPVSFIEENEGKDNLKDIYTREIVQELRLPEDRDEENGWTGRLPVIGAESVLLFGNTVNRTGDGYESILNVYSTVTGDKDVEFSLGSKSMVSTVAGTEKFFAVLAKIIDGEPSYEIEIYDKDGNSLEGFSLDNVPIYCADILWNIAIDSDERIHVVQMRPDGSNGYNGFYYLCMNKDGECLYSREYTDAWFNSFISTMQGEIYCYYSAIQALGNEHGLRETIEKIDTESGKVEFLNDERLIDCISFTAGDEILYTDKDGIWIADRKTENARLLYKWANHGMEGQEIIDLRMDEDNRIHFIQSGSDSYLYYILAPTNGDDSITEIEIAIPQWAKNKYQKAIGEFNRKYPLYKIVAVDDYDETVLKTKLISGKGPVLIDTALVDFSENKEYWLQLNDIYNEIRISGQLNEAARNLGMIDGELYGAVINYSIETIVAPKEKAGWDYEEFLKSIEDNRLKYVFAETGNSFSTILDWLGTTEDNCYFVAQDDIRTFDVGKVERVCDALGRYNELYNGEENRWPSDETLCQKVLIRTPEQLWVYMKKCGDEYDFAGFPSYEGSYNKLRPETRIAIRKTASKVEKELAVSFLNILLSYDFQKELVYVDLSWSVREDVCAEQIDSVKEGMAVGLDELYEDVFIVGEVDTDLLRQKTNELLADAVPKDYMESAFADILYDEFNDYFQGIITKEMLIDHLNSRVTIYLQENN